MFQIESGNGPVTLLRIDDGKVNAIGPNFVESFAKAWSEATASGNAIVIVGNAKAFSAGLDLKTLPTLGRDDLITFVRGFMGAFQAVAAYDRPVVVAIDGPALAGGAILALCADFRLVSPRARIGLTEVPVGIPFPGPVVEIATRHLPPQEHAPALLRGAIRGGRDAVASGWAHQFSPSETLVDEAIALAGELAQFSPIAFTSAKRGLRGDIIAQFDAFARNEAEAWVDLLMSEATMEGILASFARLTGK